MREWAQLATSLGLGVRSLTYTRTWLSGPNTHPSQYGLEKQEF